MAICRGGGIGRPARLTYCHGGGIGRRAGLRSQCPPGRRGSSPLHGTNAVGQAGTPALGAGRSNPVRVRVSPSAPQGVLKLL